MLYYIRLISSAPLIRIQQQVKQVDHSQDKQKNAAIIKNFIGVIKFGGGASIILAIIYHIFQLIINLAKQEAEEKKKKEEEEKKEKA
jgi:ammonia channel protein AmtB